MIYIIQTDGVHYLYGSARVIHNDDTTYGDIGAYSKIPESERVTIFQGRRHLNLPHELDKNTIYHTVHHTEDPVIVQWSKCHPKYKGLLLEIEQRIIDKMPYYEDAIIEVNNNKEIYPHNMYSMPGKLFIEYRNWLTWALHLVDLPHEDKVGSLLAERLFTIWMKQHEDYPHEFVTATCYDKNTGEILNQKDGVA